MKDHLLKVQSHGELATQFAILDSNNFTRQTINRNDDEKT